MAMVAQWDINNDCNLNCKHCRVLEKNTGEKELTLEQAKSLLSQLYYEGITKLNLSGGEPFLRKDLFNILDYAIKFDDIVITTNCTLINDKIAYKLAQYPNVRLSISIDGMKEIHDKFRGRTGTFQKVIDTLPILKENEIKFSIKYTLTKDTIKDVKEVLQLASKNGADEFNVRRVILAGNASKDLMISNEEYKNIIKELIQECEKSNIKFRTGDPLLIPIFPELFGIDLKEASKYYAGCEAGDEIIYIDFKGNVGACSYIPIFADNIKERPLDEILKNNQLFITLREYKEKLKGKCQKCTYKMICGGCRASALALKRSLLADDPLCLL